MKTRISHFQLVCHEDVQRLVVTDFQGQQIGQGHVEAVDCLTDVWQVVVELRYDLTLNVQLQEFLQVSQIKHNDIDCSHSLYSNYSIC